ncbi:uncharacterized protein EHS24_003280 [Apiotrichum porosum]|uniref:F-box domain-containing protein n=1 Tax=Apiotrichum porosum TaxID=105984 RepID=A0A427XG39_9TREE|nr:uncharacterized protein EHS24_003280 [Apiotrichum porosum]RSH77713.1 hypothetical protein EHS24_003280 [Apiotrichum porosum]
MSLDMDMYPHLLEAVVAASTRDTLLVLRQVSQTTRHLAHTHLFNHVRLVVHDVQDRQFLDVLSSDCATFLLPRFHLDGEYQKEAITPGSSLIMEALKNARILDAETCEIPLVVAEVIWDTSDLPDKWTFTVQLKRNMRTNCSRLARVLIHEMGNTTAANQAPEPPGWKTYMYAYSMLEIPVLLAEYRYYK